MTSESEEFMPPIRSFFILTTGGVPLFARRYEKTEEDNNIDNSDAVLLAGFLAAVEMFSRTNLHGHLLDIGFVKERYFFFRGSDDKDHLIVLSAPSEINNPYKIDPEELDIIRHILQQSWEAFSILVSASNEKNIDISELAAGFGSTLDSIILETSYIFQVDSDDIADEYERSSQDLKEKSQNIESNAFERTIEKVKSFFRRSA